MPIFSFTFFLPQCSYDLPYMRDFALDVGVWVDVTETSTAWPNVIPVWRAYVMLCISLSKVIILALTRILIHTHIHFASQSMFK